MKKQKIKNFLKVITLVVVDILIYKIIGKYSTSATTGIIKQLVLLLGWSYLFMFQFVVMVLVFPEILD